MGDGTPAEEGTAAVVVLAELQAIPAYVAITVAALGLVAVWLAFLLWGYLTGQFDDAEAAKYRVFEDEVPGPAVTEERR
jgi:cbb3-type cytochrome oxidase maturation protein